MNQWILIGHRGVGKSTLAKKLSLNSISLDQFIQDHTQKTIDSIFETMGESAFRKIENECFQELIEENKNHDVIIDVGAGFQGEKPKGWKVLWVKRCIDSSQSQFLDRPQLDGGLTMNPKRFAEREQRYSEWADLMVEVPESLFEETPLWLESLNRLMTGQSVDLPVSNSVVTLLNDKMSGRELMQKSFLNSRVELRDDLLSDQEVSLWESQADTVLQALRIKKSTAFGSLTDWPLEFGINHLAEIISLHERKKSLDETLMWLPKTDQIIKLAVPIENFTELEMGHRWWLKDPQKRVFLPSSKDGRWNWYRLLTFSKMPFSFMRSADGSSPDQPTWIDLVNYDHGLSNFAAILGDPVKHSLTPSFHRNFFKKVKKNILAIPVKEDEWDKAIVFLKELGLTEAAITSPLKQVTAQWAKSELGAVNTLSFSDDKTKVVSTDADGLVVLFKDLPKTSVAVWGGGGTLEALDSQLDSVGYYSSRTGELKSGTAQSSPDLVVWAVGHSRFSEQGVFPPSSWKPQWVVDLNYTQDSPGIACASRYGCQYRSGLAMFVRQAEKQQEFWNECWL